MGHPDASKGRDERPKLGAESGKWDQSRQRIPPGTAGF
jgi:hypothetical protein